MSSEERVIRPYEGLDRLARVLDQTTVVTTQGHKIAPGETLRLVAHEFLAHPVQLWLAPDEDGMASLVEELSVGLDEAELAAPDVEIVVVLSTPRLRYSEIVWRARAHELAEVVPHIDVTGDPRRVPLNAPHGGCRIDVYVLLARDLEEAPLRPWRKGTWLSRVRFEIKTDLGEVGFTPLPLTDVEREAHQLPRHTIRYAVVEDPFAEDNTADAVKLYVDEELLNQIALQPSLSSAKSFQRQLFVDAMAALVYTASRSDDLTGKVWGDLDGTLLGRLITRLAGPTTDRTESEHRMRCQSLLDDVRENPAKVVGWVEEIVPDLRSGLVDLLRGETT